MLEAKLLHNKTKQNCKGCKDGGIYQNLWPIPLLILVFFQLYNPLPPLSAQEKISSENAVRENGQFQIITL